MLRFCCQVRSVPRLCLSSHLERSSIACAERKHVALFHTVTLYGSSYRLALVTVSTIPGMKLKFANPVETVTCPL